MNPFKIIEKFYKKNSKAYRFLFTHSQLVRRKALEIALRNKHLKPSYQFIEEAALLHDVGIFKVRAPEIGCYGEKPYICHGYLGRQIVEKEGWPRHALVCERHVGLGISKKEIEEKKLPLPRRDMIPQTIEEKIICLADKFYSKANEDLYKEANLNELIEEVSVYGPDKVRRLKSWLKLFNLV